MMKHEVYTVTIKLDVCEAMQSKALEELRKLRVFVLGGNGTLQGDNSVFGHATVLNMKLEHTEVK